MSDEFDRQDQKPKVFTPRVRRAWEAVLGTTQGKIVMASILASTSIFRPTRSQEELAVEQWIKTLLGELDFYTEDARFPLKFVEALVPPYEQGEQRE